MAAETLLAAALISIILRTSIVEASLKIIDRHEWGSSESLDGFEKIIEVSYIILSADKAGPCFYPEECSAWMRKKQNTSVELFGDVPQNFYIGGDGLVYVGRGWNYIAARLHEPYKSKSITIYLIVGCLKREDPTNAQIRTLELFLEYAMNLGKIPKNYKIFTKYQLGYTDDEPMLYPFVSVLGHWTPVI